MDLEWKVTRHTLLACNHYSYVHTLLFFLSHFSSDFSSPFVSFIPSLPIFIRILSIPTIFSQHEKYCRVKKKNLLGISWSLTKMRIKPHEIVSTLLHRRQLWFFQNIKRLTFSRPRDGNPTNLRVQLIRSFLHDQISLLYSPALMHFSFPFELCFTRSSIHVPYIFMSLYFPRYKYVRGESYVFIFIYTYSCLWRMRHMLMRTTAVYTCT